MMEMEQVDVEGLIAAVETELPEVEHYFDVETGQVLTVVKTSDDIDESKLDQIALDNLAVAKKIKANPGEYELVPSIEAEAGFRWMQEWAATVADEHLRRRLMDVLHSCTDDCFKGFRKELLTAPIETRELWFAF